VKILVNASALSTWVVFKLPRHLKQKRLQEFSHRCPNIAGGKMSPHNSAENT
jgi:hypothetical protein